MSGKRLDTERLYLLPTTLEDAEFFMRLVNTPKWLRYIGDRNIKTVDDAKGYIEHRVLSQYKRLGYSSFTIIRKSDHEKLGVCGIYEREGLDSKDIGFAFLPEFEGQGFGYEAASALRDAAFKEFGLSELLAITSQSNLGSQKLLLKLGMQPQGKIVLPNETEELFLFSLSR
ncbi:GNAT family N-acetyltransferase [Imtechella halotolerans]|uniref:GNAT family acetyltransferase n=1 Tax=Imtechella halotolerans K1 TaxID=946077 RepID=I0WGV5_9FLAO|nr:GNAT family N-acetyltransferase [Imtechella halotolerans]EID75621.1 GNAT family acetyltransferase [Imtechella halotolerans K1]WMQ63551.1 GNAT family N-acetyltransferase [Imtechella halotolerans]